MCASVEGGPIAIATHAERSALERAQREFEYDAVSVHYLERNIEHLEEATALVHDLVGSVLERFANEGDENAERQIRMMNQLRNGHIIPMEMGLHKPGRNETVRPCVIEGEFGPIVAYLKHVIGMLQFYLDRRDDHMYRVTKNFSDDGRLVRALEPAEPDFIAHCQLTPDVTKSNIETDHHLREVFSDWYGIDAHKLPYTPNPHGVRPQDEFGEFNSSVATSALAAVFGLNAPETEFRMTEHGPASAQRGVHRNYLTPQELNELRRNGRRDPLSGDIAQTGGLHYLTGETDGGFNNLRGPISIDNGGAFLFSQPRIKDPEREIDYATNVIPYYPFNSVAWSLASHYDLTLPDENRIRIETALRDVMTYAAIRNGASKTVDRSRPFILPNEASRYPAHIRNGDTAKCLQAILRLAFERVDEKGKLIPETRAVATKEMAILLARADYLKTEGRPPTFLEDCEMTQRDIKGIIIK